MSFFNVKHFMKPEYWVRNISLISKLKLMIKFIGLLIVLEGGLILVRMSLDSFGFQYRIENKIIGYSDLDYFGVLLVILYQPLYEELAFRMVLLYSKIRLFISFSLILSIVVKVLIGRFFEIDVHNYMQYFIWEIIALVISITCIWFMFLNFHKEVAKWIQVNYNLYFFSSIFIWIILHVNNFYITIGILPVLFLTLINLFIVGYMYSYIRLRNGLFWAIALHIAYNSMVLF